MAVRVSMECGTGHDDSHLPMISAPPLSLQALTCRYGDEVVLDRVSMTLETGEILGVTGAPGAGASTLIKAIMMLVAPQGGRVLIMGKPHQLASSRSLVAHLPETIRPPGHLTGHDFITMTRAVQAGSFGAADVGGLAADLALDSDLLAYPIRRYAKDEVQKLGLIALFSADRPILLLDRPMSDLDPAARAGVRHRLKRHTANGGAVLIGSHAIEDHQGVVDRLVLLKDRRLIDSDVMDFFDTTGAAA